jgi:predicted site-specific integrase-resolvase
MKKKPHGQPDLYSPLIYRISTLVRILGVSRFTIYRWVRKGIFPKPINLGPNRPCKNVCVTRGKVRAADYTVQSTRRSTS